ncbi:hypothetical protein NKG94_22470 [Micromonospora sp. M12]
MDPPDHTRLRRLVAKAFTARRVEALRPRTQEIADALVDNMVQLGPPADLVEHVATPLPIQVICELLGVSYADRDRFHIWSEAIVSTTSLPTETIQEYLNSLWGYIGGLVAERRRDPGSTTCSVRWCGPATRIRIGSARPSWWSWPAGCSRPATRPR